MVILSVNPLKMRYTLFILFLLPALAFSQNRVGINIDTPAFKLDVRSVNDSLDSPDLQLATPSSNHFLRMFGGRDFDARPYLLFSDMDTFRIATSQPNFTDFTERITVLPDGRVGINNMLPSRRLHVYGDGLFSVGSSITSASDTGALTIIDSHLGQLSMDGNKIQTYNVGDMGTSLLYVQPYGGNINFGSGDIILNNATSAVELTGTLRLSPLNGIGDRNLVVDPLGYVKVGPGGSDTDWEIGPSVVYNLSDRVGLGFLNPSAKLQVFGAENDLVSATVKIVNALQPLGADTMYIDGNEIDVATSGLSSPVLALQRNSFGSIEMVTGGGNVGVGTNAPLKRRMTVSGLSIPEEGSLAELPATFSIINITQDDFNELVMDGNEIHSVDNDLFINSKTQHNVSIAGGGGNVSIGTNTMATGYRLSVDGGIIGEEVRVQYTSMWPDYVFEQDYDLMSLDALDEEIKDLGHLPGIPSAAEVSDQGIDLGDMDARLLEKIEELTLHVIALNKRLKALEEENAELKETLSK